MKKKTQPSENLAKAVDDSRPLSERVAEAIPRLRAERDVLVLRKQYTVSLKQFT